MDYKTIFAFNGIQRQVSPFLTGDGDLSESQNTVIKKIGTLKKSFDYTVKGSQLTEEYSVNGGIDFYRNDGTHDHVVSVNGDTNSEIYIHDTDWTDQAQNLAKDYRIRFAYSPTIDTLFACNYADATRSYDGSSWSTATDVTDSPKAKYAFSFGDRIYLLNCSVDGTSYPSRAYRSSAIETEATWDTVNDYIVFNDVINGVSMNGENLFVACQSSTHIFTLDDEKFQVSNTGCVSHESLAQYSNFTFYASRNGFYAFDGSNTFKVSTPIQEYWDKIPEANTENIQAVSLGDHVYVYIGDIEAPWDSSQTLQNVIFDYNALQNNWSRGRLASDCTNLHTYVTTSGRSVFMGDSSGYVYTMFDGSGQQDGSDYSSFIETPWIYGTGAGVLDDFKELWGYGDKLSGFQVLYKTEEVGNWNSIGELNEDTDVVKFNTRSYKIKFRLQEYSGENLYELSRLDVGWEPAYERYEDRTRE